MKDYEITRILCQRLDKRKKALHVANEDHLSDHQCQMLREAIKDDRHPMRKRVLADIRKENKPRKKKKKKRARRKQKPKLTTQNVAWLPRDEWERQTEKFYTSQRWKELRYEVLRKSAGACSCCGARASDGVRLHVDHIKPRSRYPDMQWDIENLQVLCEDCNFGKSNYYNDDWRVKM